MGMLYPLLLQPALHQKVWGGRRFESLLNKALPADGQPYGESWELHDTATVVNGALAGQTLGELLNLYGELLIGRQAHSERGVPLLAKFIDSTEWLSVQVHPSDDQCMQLENARRGKTEAWYIVAAEPGAQLIIGVAPGTPRAEIAQAIRRHSLKSLLVYADIRAGDVLYIPTGTIHALGPGIVIYEIQQSSDTTYRLYDWDRPGLDGKPRDLHVEKSLAVANTDSLPDILHTAGDESPALELLRGDFFTTTLYQLRHSSIEVETGESFHALTCIEGGARVEAAGVEVELGLGQTVLIPADLDRYTLRGQARILRSSQR